MQTEQFGKVTERKRKRPFAKTDNENIEHFQITCEGERKHAKTSKNLSLNVNTILQKLKKGIK